MADSIGSDVLVSESLNEIGNVFTAQKHYQEALDKYGEALSFAQSASFPLGQIESLAGLGGVYYSKCDYSRSLDCYLQCRELVENYSIGIYKTVIRCALIRNYARLGRVEEMETELNRFIEDYDELQMQNAGFIDENASIYQNASNISQQYDDLFAQSDFQNRQMRAYRLAFFGLLAIVLSVSFALLLRHLRKKR